MLVTKPENSHEEVIGELDLVEVLRPIGPCLHEAGLGVVRALVGGQKTDHELQFTFPTNPHDVAVIVRVVHRRFDGLA